MIIKKLFKMKFNTLIIMRKIYMMLMKKKKTMAMELKKMTMKAKEMILITIKA